MIELKLRRQTTGAVDHRLLGTAPSLSYPRTYGQLRRYARRHPSGEARSAVSEIDASVDEKGWRWVKRKGGKRLQIFYSSASEVFQEIANAILGIDLVVADRNTLVGRWEFGLPVEDFVLNLLHGRNPGYRIVLVDGLKAFVRDGCGVLMDRADSYRRELVAIRPD